MALPAPRVFTADDLSLPPYRDLNCALWDGTLLVHDGHGGCSGPVAARIVAKLLEHVDDRGLGWVGDSGTGFRLRRNPDRVLVPDASFTSRSRLAAWPAKGPREVVPNLVAEVRSPNDSWTAFVAKGGKWLAHGVEVVWLVDPGERTATTLRETGDPVIVSVENALSGAPALPNLTIPLADLLQGLT
jgi:Uma2 family endonuclease